MVKLYKKTEQPMARTTIWAVEKTDRGTVVRRKQFTLYNTTLADVEKILAGAFKEK